MHWAFAFQGSIPSSDAAIAHRTPSQAENIQDPNAELDLTDNNTQSEHENTQADLDVNENCENVET